MMLSAQDLVWRAGRRAIVDRVSLDVRPGEFLGLVGPNGSGKTSLIAMLAGLRAPASGTVTLAGKPLGRMSRRDLAHRIALVEQQAETGERLTAREAVALGRTPHLSALSPWSSRDDAIVDKAMADVDMAHLASRSWQTLSGGERQRLHIARALAQEPRILILDEPTNHLDIEHQIGLLDLVRSQDLTVVAALHDLNHAAMFCDRIAVMQAGRLVALGTPADILTRRRLAEVFRVDASVEIDAAGACFIRYRRPAAMPRARHAAS
ncbi:iron complex transport system ATP-binding protein [Chelatococcus caeni]|uniref:Iron complex transport system ATP-binding protein n=1 Tax=Chelatococcus caeni TaxID=1348468 RepID=A0A840BXM9_9HYPH|nr:ABC transporter ATP-binding protein [Chelatococcus caeni]MBB4016208.1 iron complex transport system ATP-binding protein [Chelatococcus caeni]